MLGVHLFAMGAFSPMAEATGDRVTTPMPAPAMTRLWRQVAAITGRTPPPRDRLWRACAGEMACIARRLAMWSGPRARLERVVHPDTDTIRMIHSLPTVTETFAPAPGVLRLRIVRFGRKAVREVRAILAQRRSLQLLQIDLRGHPGGSLRNMMRLAGAFLGPVPRAFALRDAHGALRWLDLPANGARLTQGGARGEAPHIEILVDERTASSAEVFAALMRQYGGARILGRRTYGKDWLLRAVAVSHDWRLLLPAERIVVPGERLAGGLVPDAPLIEAMPALAP